MNISGQNTLRLWISRRYVHLEGNDDMQWERPKSAIPPDDRCIDDWCGRSIIPVEDGSTKNKAIEGKHGGYDLLNVHVTSIYAASNEVPYY